LRQCPPALPFSVSPVGIHTNQTLPRTLPVVAITLVPLFAPTQRTPASRSSSNAAATLSPAVRNPATGPTCLKAGSGLRAPRTRGHAVPSAAVTERMGMTPRQRGSGGPPGGSRTIGARGAARQSRTAGQPKGADRTTSVQPTPSSSLPRATSQMSRMRRIAEPRPDSPPRAVRFPELRQSAGSVNDAPKACRLPISTCRPSHRRASAASSAPPSSPPRPPRS